MPTKILLLISSTTPDLVQKSNIEKSLHLLRAKKIEFDTVDGSDPNVKEKRNALFAVSGIRGKYPQWFQVADAGDDLPTFVGMWDEIEAINDRGELKF
mmetsp:Transcript_7654/g.16612  ORF Transcript_7654/g.16612 Transcript_7654/m.16612 type:complete len:98 (+) Transcript_7654:121-414(+)